MQQVKIYTSGWFKGEARNQFFRDAKKMAKSSWHVHTVTDEGGTGRDYTDRYKIVYEKKEASDSRPL